MQTNVKVLEKGKQDVKNMRKRQWSWYKHE